MRRHTTKNSAIRLVAAVLVINTGGCGTSPSDSAGTTSESAHPGVQTIAEIADGIATVTAAGNVGVVITNTPDNHNDVAETVAVNTSGTVQKVDNPPWYGQWIAGSAPTTSGGIAVTTFECPAERSYEDTSCSSDYLMAVWASDTGERWSRVAAGAIDGTANNSAISVFSPSALGASNKETIVVDLYDRSLLLSVIGSTIETVEIPHGVTAACALAGGAVVQLRDSGEQAKLAGTATDWTIQAGQPGNTVPPSSHPTTLAWFSPDGKQVRQIETGGRELICGQDNTLGLRSYETRSVSLVDAASGRVGPMIEGPTPTANPIGFDESSPDSVLYQSPDGRRLWACTASECSSLLELDPAAEWATVDLHTLDGAAIATTVRWEQPETQGRARSNTRVELISTKG